MKRYLNRFPPPLRYTIPLMIVLFGSLSGLTSFVLEINESYRNAERTAASNLRTATAQSSRILEYLYRVSDSENQIKTLVSQLGSYPDYVAAMILSENNTILQSNDYRQKGIPISVTSLRSFQSAIDRVRQTQAGTVLGAQHSNQMLALYPVPLGSQSYELKPSRVGVLLVEVDLGALKRNAFAMALRRALILNISLVVFCLLILLFFEFALNRRIQKLVATSNQLGEGRLQSRSILNGSDELAQVSVAFDNMADKMQINSIKLERQASREKLLREINDRIWKSLDLDRILATALPDILDYLRADRVAIYRFTPGSQCTRGQFIAESIHSEVDSILNQEVEDTCFTHQLIELYLAGRTSVIEDVQTASVPDCYIELLAKFNIRANAAFPLISSANLWGFLCVHSCRHSRQWSEEELKFIGSVASQISIAIQQSSLFAQIQAELLDKKSAEERLTHLNHQLADANIQLERATRLKDEFLANMSHELRTPLNGILGMAESLDDSVYGDLSVKQSTALQEIINSGQHLLSLINDILDITKIEAGQFQIEASPTSVSELALSSLATVKQLIASKGLELDSDIQPAMPLCLVDPKLLKQILINLLSNAIKFTPPGGKISIRAFLENAAEDQEKRKQLVFEVADTGIGIDPQDQARIFMPFIQIQGSLNRQYGGTGLGLSIVRKLVEAHGGSIDLVSEAGKGSCFTVKLPFHPAAAARNHSASGNQVPSPGLPAAMAAKGDGSNVQAVLPARILLAEDNKVNSLMYLRYLRAKGYHLLLACNGEEAVEMAMNQAIDVLLLDISMPLLDGFEVMRRLRSSEDARIANLPIIVLTALAMKGDRERCLAAGADDYLSKPVKLNQLDIAIKQALSCGAKKG